MANRTNIIEAQTERPITDQTNLPFDYICIINLKRDKKRLKSAKSQLKREGLRGGKCVDAVDGYKFVPYGELIKNKIRTRYYSKKMRVELEARGLLKQSRRQLIPGEIGLIQSLVRTFKKILTKTNYKRILIVEDDFKIPDNFVAKLKKIIPYIPENTDVLYLGFSPVNYKYSKFTSINKYIEKSHGISDPKVIKRYNSKGGIYGTFGFIINRKGMREYIKAAKPMEFPADVILGRLSTIDKVINTYNLKKEYQLISYFKFGSSIHK